MRLHRFSVALLFVAPLLWCTDVLARRSLRHRFEPTDLELEPAGTAELDVQVGVGIGEGPPGDQAFLPDFELDVGLTDRVELDVDGAFSLDRFDSSKSRRWGGEALWTAAKLGLLDLGNDSHDRPFEIGLQLGPRWPTVGQRGIGYAAVALFGTGNRRLHVVANAGGIIDPGPQITSGQSKSVVGGVDADLDLDRRGDVELFGEIGAAHYLSPEPDELLGTLGVSYRTSRNLELSVAALGGFLFGSRRALILFGFAPKATLF